MEGMRKMKETIEALTSFFLIPVLAGSLLFLDGCATASQKESSIKAGAGAGQEGTEPGVKQEQPNDRPGAAAVLPGITVSFKLDPRITQGMYMGDRWVSPPTYTSVHEGTELTVEAKAHGLDARKRPRNIRPEWIPEDSGMVTVTPSQGHEVKITVHRAGQSKLKVVSSGVHLELLIKAKYEGNVIQVEISK